MKMAEGDNKNTVIIEANRFNSHVVTVALMTDADAAAYRSAVRAEDNSEMRAILARSTLGSLTSSTPIPATVPGRIMDQSETLVGTLFRPYPDKLRTDVIDRLCPTVKAKAPGQFAVEQH